MRFNFKYKISALLSAVAFVMPVLSGCGGGRHEPDPPDPTKTQVYVGNLDGGLGDEWLQKIKTEFPNFYKDTSFEE